MLPEDANTDLLEKRCVNNEAFEVLVRTLRL